MDIVHKAKLKAQEKMNKRKDNIIQKVKNNNVPSFLEDNHI